MPDVLTALTGLAVSVFRTRVDPSKLTGAWLNKFIRATTQCSMKHSRMSYLLPDRYAAIEDVVNLALSQPELAVLAPREGELDPMLMHPGGGSRMSGKNSSLAYFSSAFLQMYFLRLPQDEGTFVRTVLEGFEELRRAARGERIRAHAITGIARITLPEGAQVLTPWGVIRPAQPKPDQGGLLSTIRPPRTTCLLTEPRLLPVRFDRAPTPQQFDPSETAPTRSTVLFPLSCALASKETAKPIVPLLTWSTLLLPFQVGLDFMLFLLPPFGAEADVSKELKT